MLPPLNNSSSWRGLNIDLVKWVSELVLSCLERFSVIHLLLVHTTVGFCDWTCFISWKLLERWIKVACTFCPGFSQATKAILTAPVSSRRVEILPLSKLKNKSTVYLQQQAQPIHTSQQWNHYLGWTRCVCLFLSVSVCCKPGWAVLHYTSRSWRTGALAERLKGIFNTTWSAAVKPWAQISVVIL